MLPVQVPKQKVDPCVALAKALSAPEVYALAALDMAFQIRKEL